MSELLDSKETEEARKKAAEDLKGAWSKVLDVMQTDNNSVMFDFVGGYKELEGYSVKLSSNPNAINITKNLAKIQGHKDRVTEMLIVANNVCGACKRTYQAAYERHYIGLSSGTVAEKEFKSREAYRLQYNLYLRSEEYALACKQYLDNLKSTQEILSRQITILQLEFELGNVRRGEGLAEEQSLGETTW